MRPLVVLLGIVMGSTVSIAAALLLTGVVFLLLPEYAERLADESKSLAAACVLSVLLAGVAATSFYGELKGRSWRFAAHGALLVALTVVRRQSAALAIARELEALRTTRGALEVTQSSLQADINRARSRAVLVPLAQRRLGLRLPQDSEITILQNPARP